MIPNAYIVGEPVRPLNTQFGKPDFKIYRPHFETGNTLNRQIENKQVEVLSKQDAVGIIHNPYNTSLGCRSISDLKQQGTIGPTGVSLDTQKLNARPAGPLHTKAMVQNRAGKFGANFSQSNQFPASKFSTWAD